jgi:hypothetical protein
LNYKILKMVINFGSGKIPQEGYIVWINGHATKFDPSLN